MGEGDGRGVGCGVLETRRFSRPGVGATSLWSSRFLLHDNVSVAFIYYQEHY